MGLVEEVGDTEKTHVMQMSNTPRDLLQRFMSVNHFPVKFEEPSDDTEEIELSLGLSLNGRFGVDPKANRLTRSSSIPDFAHSVRDGDMLCAKPMAYTPLIRSCSLPTETEEEWRKRKELQTLRRMEAKRKRSEKQRISKAVRKRNRAFAEEICEDGSKRQEGVNGNHQTEQCVKDWNEFTSLMSSSLGMRASGLQLNGEQGIGLDGGGLKRQPSSLPPASSSQVSNGSQGTGSSGITETESQPNRGISILLFNIRHDHGF